MQEELAAEATAMPIHLFGVNAPGTEGWVLEMVEGRMLPLLQDTTADPVSAAWGAQHFDLIVLGPDNTVAAVISLRDRDLADPASYDAVKATLEDLAAERAAACTGAAIGSHAWHDPDSCPGHDGAMPMRRHR